MKTVLCGIIFMSVWQYDVLQMKFFLVISGLGHYVGEAIAESGIGCKYKVLGAKDEYVSLASPAFLYRENEMDTEGLIKNMKAFL